MTSARPAASVAFLVIAFAVICALLLALPAQTVTTKYLNDLFVFLDGVHRIAEGQVPNRDFGTALGPLVYYLPALGYGLSGTMGGAMPVGMALLVLAVAPAAAAILASRLRPAIGLPVAAYLFLVLAVPANLGESVAALSFAMFYNRIGWAALGFLLILYLPPLRPRAAHAPLDAVCGAGLVLLMIYSKISYGAVGVAFLIFLLLDPRQRGWAGAALALVLTGCLSIEAVWGGSASHLGDLATAARVSVSRGSPDRIAELFLRNLADTVLFGIFATLALRRTRGVRDFLFFGFCAGAGFALIAQNFQTWGVVTLGAGAAVAAETLARLDGDAAERRRRSPSAGVQLLLFAFLLPTIVHTTASLVLHAGLAAAGRGTAVPLPNFDRIRLVGLWTGGDYPAFSRYLSSLEDGARGLRELEVAPERVLVLDFVNPFPAGLGLPPVEGDSTWHHWGRTIDEVYFPPADKLFGNVRIVLEPKWPIEHWTAAGLRDVYAEHLSERYELSHETADWKVFLARPSPADTVGGSSGRDGAHPEGGSARGG